MIISASRRTDIPSYYSDWFFNRIADGFVTTRNPMNYNQVKRIELTPEAVDCIVFWTKNPKPMIESLDKLGDYNYYFQFTLNSYGKDIEENIPSKNDEIIQTFQKLADKIGKEKVIWRYDPILLNEKYNIDYHVNYFGKIAEKLKNYTEKCTISFIDFYKNITTNIKPLYLAELNNETKTFLAKELSKIAFGVGLKMDTCAEDLNLDEINIGHARCIDDLLIQRIIGYTINAEKDKNQRLECGCVKSIDIGTYNTCNNRCKYCYANHSQNILKKNNELYDPNSPLLCCELNPEDKVNERVVKSIKCTQTSIF